MKREKKTNEVKEFDIGGFGMMEERKIKYIRKQIDSQLENIKSDLKDDRDISAIISGIGLIYADEHIEAKKYLKELGVLK